MHGRKNGLPSLYYQRCVYIEPGSNKDGRNRKTNPSTTSNHPRQDSQKSTEDEHAVDKSVTSDSFFTRQRPPGSGYSFQSDQGTTASSFLGEERSSPTLPMSKSLSNTNGSLESANSISGSLKADFFDFDDFTGSQAYGDFTLPPECLWQINGLVHEPQHTIRAFER